MNFDAISRDMIRPMYEQALNKPLQIQILAQLTASSEAQICRELGLPVQESANVRKVFDEDEAMALYEKGMNDKKMAERLKISPDTVAAWRKRNGLCGNKRQWMRVDEKKIGELYRQGQTDKTIAQELRVAISTVAKWRQKRKLPTNTPKPIFDEYEARHLYEKGATDKEIGRAIGYHSASVQVWRSRNGLPAQCRRRKG